MPLQRLADFFSTYQPRKAPQPADSIQAAVLCPLFIDQGTVKMLFIKRSQTVKTHKGEISFPGGVHESGDESLRWTSLRETEEEIGVHSRDVNIFGRLDEVDTSTGFRVAPFIGQIPYPYGFRLSSEEVDHLETVAIEDFYAPDNRIEFHYFNGRRLTPQLAYNIKGRIIWGATAKIMARLLELGCEHKLFQASSSAYYLAC